MARVVVLLFIFDLDVESLWINLDIWQKLIAKFVLTPPLTNNEDMNAGDTS